MAGKTKFLLDAEKLKAARKKAALSLEDLSNIAYGEESKKNPNSKNPDERGFSESDIQKYEKGGAWIYADKLKRISDILDVDPKELIFFEPPFPFASSIEFNAWCYFVNNISEYSKLIQGAFLFHKYSNFVRSNCGAIWDELSSRSAASSVKPPKVKKHNVIYTATRKFRLRKKDFEDTKKVLIALVRKREEAIILSASNHHIAELFKRNLLKHQRLLQVMKEKVEQGEISYSLSEITELTTIFAVMVGVIEGAQRRAEEESFHDIYGDGDEAEYYYDIIDEFTYKEFYNSFPEEEPKKSCKDTEKDPLLTKENLSAILSSIPQRKE